MSSHPALRWWPPIGILAMVALGLAVGKASTPLDDWFTHAGNTHRSLSRVLLTFTQPVVLAVLLVGAIGVASYRRRWRLAVVVVLTPLAAVIAVRMLKELFGRERGGSLAYPSGHVTVLVTVLGMVVVVAGARAWVLVAAAVFALLGTLGQAVTYHYFTDTVGAALLSTAVVCLAAGAAKLDRCQPGCDLHHSGG